MHFLCGDPAVPGKRWGFHVCVSVSVRWLCLWGSSSILAFCHLSLPALGCFLGAWELLYEVRLIIHSSQHVLLAEALWRDVVVFSYQKGCAPGPSHESHNLSCCSILSEDKEFKPGSCWSIGASVSTQHLGGHGGERAELRAPTLSFCYLVLILRFYLSHSFIQEKLVKCSFRV